VTHERIGFTHAGEDSNGPEPERNANEDAPPGCQRERKTSRGEAGEQHQFPVTAEKKVKPIGRLINHDLSMLVRRLHPLDRRSRNAEGAAHDVRREDDHRDNMSHQRGSPCELVHFTAPEQRGSRGEHSDDGHRECDRPVREAAMVCSGDSHGFVPVARRGHPWKPDRTTISPSYDLSGSHTVTRPNCQTGGNDCNPALSPRTRVPISAPGYPVAKSNRPNSIGFWLIASARDTKVTLHSSHAVASRIRRPHSMTGSPKRQLPLLQPNAGALPEEHNCAP
jgi:hypothetical protein